MKKTFNIKGMHCKSCVMLIEDAVSEVPGVAKTKASLEKNNVMVEFDESRTSESKIKDAIKKEGYET